MDLSLNNLQRLISHKTNQPTNQPTINYRGTETQTPAYIFVTVFIEFDLIWYKILRPLQRGRMGKGNEEETAHNWSLSIKRSLVLYRGHPLLGGGEVVPICRGYSLHILIPDWLGC